MTSSIASRFLAPLKHHNTNLNTHLLRCYFGTFRNHDSKTFNKILQSKLYYYPCYQNHQHHSWIQKDILPSMKQALSKFGGFSFLTSASAHYLSVAQVTDLLRQERGKDICAINISPEYCYVDHLIICSGSSARHLKGMANALKSQFRGKHLPGIGKVIIEGEDCQDWMVIDIGNMVVHFFLPETREKYQLEKLWLLGPKYDDQSVSMSLTEGLMNQHWKK